MSLKFYAQFAKHEPILSWQTRHYHFRVRCQQFQDMVTVYLSYTGKSFRKDTFLHHSGLLMMFVIRICSWRRKKQLNLFQFSLKFWRRALSKCFWCYCQWHSGRFTFSLYANLITESLESGSSVVRALELVFEEAGQSQEINSGIINIK